MSDATDLLFAVLGPEGLTMAEMGDVLEAALEREIDPLLYCTTHYLVPTELAMARVASRLGCAFIPFMPEPLKGEVDPLRLEMLAEPRVFRREIAGRELAFAAPDFFGLVKLARKLRTAPDLRRRLVMMPQPALQDYLAQRASEQLMVEARHRVTRLWPYAAAQLDLTKAARWAFVLGILLLILLIFLSPHVAPTWLWPFNLILIGPAIVRLAAIATPPRPRQKYPRIDDAELPVYSVLIPLRNEAQMVTQLFEGLSRLDYPPERLDIKFVVEATSPSTVAAVRAGLGDPRFSLVVVPDAMPRTKPKALNYALPLCRGEYVVVYDAEDVPAPDQLRKAAVRFRDDPRLACLQAQLVISNGRRGPLAALFAGEYAGLFGVLLPALAKWCFPMPLGGTSNHFDIGKLRQIGGWDPFNVTEDADLGARLARLRLEVDVLDSVTYEIAPRSLKFWLGQRTRWMKGWMMTFIVHNRRPTLLASQMSPLSVLAFEVVTLGMITAPLLHCGMALDTFIRLALGMPLLDGSATGVSYIFILLFGYGTTIALSVQGLLRLGRSELVIQQALLPAYWLLIAAATVRAMRELLTQPFYWFKSPHEPNGALPPRHDQTTRPADRGAETAVI